VFVTNLASEAWDVSWLGENLVGTAIQGIHKKENTYIAGSMSLFGNIVVRFLEIFIIGREARFPKAATHCQSEKECVCSVR
jgi:hypothetical protein